MFRMSEFQTVLQLSSLNIGNNYLLVLSTVRIEFSNKSMYYLEGILFK